MTAEIETKSISLGKTGTKSTQSKKL